MRHRRYKSALSSTITIRESVWVLASKSGVGSQRVNEERVRAQMAKFSMYPGLGGWGMRWEVGLSTCYEPHVLTDFLSDLHGGHPQSPGEK